MNKQEIINESKRCLNCANPNCKKSCPLGVNIPKMLEAVKNNDFEKAYEIDFERNPLGIICGMVCPHEKQCEGACIRGIKEKPLSIGKIEHFVCKEGIASNDVNNYELSSNAKVAIIGGGPAGISCAHELSKFGIKSTIFEKEAFLGGILMYGIPDFRLDKEMVKNSIKRLLNENIDVVYNVKFEYQSNNLNFDFLRNQGYKYIVIATGLESNKSLNIPGIDSNKVLYAKDYLRSYFEKDNLTHNKRIAVIGGGNVAIDTARVAKKLGNQVTIIYRKTREKMPANNDEVESAIKEGVDFIFETNVIKIEEGNYLKLLLDTNDTFIVDNLIIAIRFNFR